MTFRHLLSWKFGFYELLLPALRRLGPARCDAILGGLGRLIAALWPPRRTELTGARSGEAALGADWDPEAVRPALAANCGPVPGPRLPPRRPPTTTSSPGSTSGASRTSKPRSAAAAGPSWWGATWGATSRRCTGSYRRGVPLRLLVQRPRHVSSELDRRFDRDGPHPQSGFFLRRDLSPALAAERLLRARAALRDGLAVYLSGDIPWSGPNTRPGRLLGRTRPFLSVWADLAVLTRVPVFLLFCTHRPGGRYALTIEPPGPSPPATKSRPSPATSPASNPRSPPTPPTPSPTSSGPATPDIGQGDHKLDGPPQPARGLGPLERSFGPSDG